MNKIHFLFFFFKYVVCGILSFGSTFSYCIFLTLLSVNVVTASVEIKSELKKFKQMYKYINVY